MKKNIILICGGGGTEHDISLISADYIENKINPDEFNIHRILIEKDGQWKIQGLPIDLNFKGEIVSGSEKFKVDAAIPCLHGPPGETGEIQGFLELVGVPYLGCNSESSILCFNKLATKLFLENAGIKTTPFLQINRLTPKTEISNFFERHENIYVKATNQGSSVGCYHITESSKLFESIMEAFTYSPFVILEKTVKGRELEVAAFEHQGRWSFTHPGEIVCPESFYSYEEKYSEQSETETLVEAKNLSEEIINQIKTQSEMAQELLKIRHLARIDFFLSEEGNIYINEINTFPGHTSISMFPMMLENTGLSYSDFINQHLNNLTSN